MSVKYREDRQKWQADLRFAGRGRPLFDTRKEAIDAEKAAKLKKLGLGGEAERPKILIGVGFREYYDKESKPRKSRVSAANDSWYFNLANQYLTGLRLEHLDDIGLQHLEDLQRWLLPARSLGKEVDEAGREREVKKDEWSPSTVNRAFHTYDHFFTKMCAWGYLDKNPALYLKSLPENPVKRAPMTDEIYQAVMSHKDTPVWFKDVLEFIADVVEINSVADFEIQDFVATTAFPGRQR